MKPISIDKSCRETFSSLQKPLVDCILQTANPDKIFLLKATLQWSRTESIFQDYGSTTQQIKDCVLLVLIPSQLQKRLIEWQEKIENRCKSIMPVTVIVLSSHSFEIWIREGRPFACAVCQSATQIYESQNSTWAIPDPASIESSDNDSEREIYTDGLAKAKEFLAGASLFQARKQYSMAAFMLHQSAEQALHTILYSGTGYYMHTHCLDRLIRCASLLSNRLQVIFNPEKDLDVRLFKLLQNAYIDVRYTMDYSINDYELSWLYEKVRQVHVILEDVGKRKFQAPELSVFE